MANRQRYQTTRKPTPQTLTERELQQACTLWRESGHLALGNWAAKTLNPWDHIAWRDLIDVVRNELQDYADHS